MIVVQAEIQHPAGALPVVLVESKAWADRGVDPRAKAQQDPITTAFTPTVVPEKGANTWLLTGYRLHAHDEPGDTLVTYTLLLEIDADGAIEGWWHEDHMEVPTSLWKVTGTLQGHTLALTLAGDEPRTVSALFYRRPEPKRK